MLYGVSLSSLFLLRMELFWSDSCDRLDPAKWEGLQINVRDAPKPTFSVETCRPLCIRLAANGVAIAWARIEKDWYGYDLLRSLRNQSLHAIPPISFDRARQNSMAKDATSTDRAWAVTFATALAQSKMSPLSNGHWHLGHFGQSFEDRELSTDIVQHIATQRLLDYIRWDGREVYPITLRKMSLPEEGRVKAFRKLAREKLLPPILLYWVSGLQAHVVLDGHDRLQAAFLENMPALALSLKPVAKYEPNELHGQGIYRIVERALSDRAEQKDKNWMTVDTANRLLFDAYTPRVNRQLTKARILAGGINQWASEVRQALAKQEHREHLLLDELDGGEDT